jgi:hypothetical protein
MSGSLTYLRLIYYADFKHTWISIHARAAGQSRPYLKNFLDFEHGLGKNLKRALKKLLTFFGKLSDFEHGLGKNLSVC